MPPKEEPRLVPPPEPFSFQPRDWLAWKRRWEHYHLLSSLGSKSADYQIAALLYHMGERADDILATLGLSEENAKVYEEVFKAFNTHFVGQRNVVYERAVFGSRCQEPEETIEAYVTALHSLVDSCEYGDLKQELLRDRIVLGVRDIELRKKLMLTDKLTLDKAVEISKQWENVKIQQKSLHADSNPTHLDAMKKGKMVRSLKRKFVPSDASLPSSSRTQETLRECKFCGLRHEMKKVMCPALNKECILCKQVGHFAKKCPSSSSAPPTQTDPPASMDRVIASNQETFLLGAINADSDRSRSQRWTASVSCDAVPITFKLDSGADSTAIPYYLFRKMWKTRRLQDPDRVLVGPAGSPLPIAGKFTCLMKNNDKQVKEDIYVVYRLEKPLLSLRACEDLKLIKRLSNLNDSLTAVRPEAEYSELFSGLGKLDMPYTIKLSANAEPFALFSPRRVPIPLLSSVKEKLELMVQQGIIEPVDEPTEWCSPLVTAPKSNGDIRLCVDLTALNRYVEREIHPMPVVEHTLAQLGNAKVFSKLDANSGFHQILLSPESRKLTTFITPFGRFCYRRLPFGISSAPEHFQKRMEQILTGLPGIVIHVDDTLIYGATKEEHDRRLRDALDRIRDSGLTLNKDKCVFGASSVKFLGHIIDDTGIKPDPEKILAIVNYPTPTTVTEVRSFIGMVTYLSRFIPHHSTVCKPLLDLLRNSNDFVWGAYQQDAFDSLKEILSSEPVLARYDPNRETVVSSDSSSYGLGSLLLQKQDDGTLKPVAYASRTLSAAERRYAQIEKETLGIVWACERFRDYVLGKSITIETDHKPLLQVLQTKELDALSPRLQRLRMRLMWYTYKIKFVPGKQLVLADTLSRQPLLSTGSPELEREVAAHVCHVLSHLPVSDEKLSEIWKAQHEDPTLKKVIECCSSIWPGECEDPLLKPYWNVRESLTVQDGLLLKDCRIVIPPSLRDEILGRIHEGHMGIVKCRARAQGSCWWPGLSVAIAEMVRRCIVCVKERSERKEPLLPSPFPTRPWQRLAMDLFKLSGSWYIVVVDYFSRYPEVAQLNNLSSAAVIDFLKKIFSRHGVPDEVVSDNGTQFHPVITSAFQSFAADYGFQHTTASPLFPQSNGFAENAVKIMKNLLTKSEDKYKALLEYRVSPLANGYSPSELLMGRRLRSTLPVKPSLLIPATVDIAKLREKEQHRRDRNKQDFDRRHGAIEKPAFQPGEVVWVKDRRSWGKVIGEAGTPRSYLVDTPSGQFRRNASSLTRAFTTEYPDRFGNPGRISEDIDPRSTSPVQCPAGRPPSSRVKQRTRRLIEET